jgi:2,3-bisphosphoglycerate-independent phosphoglycerate mutase
MMAKPITDRLVEAMGNRSFDFILVNYANPDTIAHTADYDAGVAAVRIIDHEIGRVLKAGESSGALVAITGDHGNMEEMINPMTGLPESQHDPSPVPFYLMGEEFRGRKFINQDSLLAETLGSLADVAPTLLEIMNIPKPPEMTGRSLLEGLV